MKSKIITFFSSLKAKLGVFRNKKKVFVSLLSLVFALAILALAVYYIRFRQNTSPTQASGVLLQLAGTAGNITWLGGGKVRPDSEFSVDVYMNSNGMSVTGADIEVKYDPKQLSAISVNQGATLLPVVFVPGQISLGLAKIVLGCKPTTPVTGNGILASVKFKTIGSDGTTATISVDPSASPGPATAISALGQSGNVLSAAAFMNVVISSVTPAPLPSGPGTVPGGGVKSALPAPTSSPSVSPTPTPTPTPGLTSKPSIKPLGVTK